jgi:hypothetical protein
VRPISPTRERRWWGDGWENAEKLFPPAAPLTFMSYSSKVEQFSRNNFPQGEKNEDGLNLQGFTNLSIIGESNAFSYLSQTFTNVTCFNIFKVSYFI